MLEAMLLGAGALMVFGMVFDIHWPFPERPDAQTFEDNALLSWSAGLGLGALGDGGS
jgi:hypothetical protein